MSRGRNITSNVSKAQGIHFRAAVSIALVASLIASWSLSSVAAAPPGEASTAATSTVETSEDAPPVGQLTVKKGDVTINGNATKTGATVLSGSLIATSSDGEAVIDLGALGRVELGSRTTVLLSFEPGVISVKSECGRTEIEVFRGQVDVKSPKVETIQAAHDEEYADPVEATAPAGTDFRVECERRKLIVLIPLSLSGIALIGLRSGVEVVGAPPSGERPPTTPTTP